MAGCGRRNTPNENPHEGHEEVTDESSGKRKMVLLVRDDTGKLQEVKICALSRAAATDDAATVTQLLEHVADDPEFLNTSLRCKDACFGYTAFHWAAKYGATQALQVLLKYSEELGNIHVTLSDPFSSKKQGSEGKAKTVSSLFTHDNPLHVACQSSQLDCVKLLIQHGMSPVAPNNRNQTPLHFACTELDLPIIMFLIEDCELPIPDINHAEKDCDTPLFKILRSKVDDQAKKLDCLNYLLTHGADPLVKGCFGATSVQRATLTQDPNILRVLLDNLRDQCTQSQMQILMNLSKGMLGKPLDLALEDHRGKDLDIIHLLLSNGAKPTLKNFDHICRENDDLDFLKAFMENPQVLNGLVQELNTNGFCRHDEAASTPPFISIINSEALTPKQILQWLDYALQKVKPDLCYSRDHDTKKFFTPLAMLIRCMGDIIISFHGEDIESKEEAPDFPFRLVHKLVMGGSDVNGYIMPSKKKRKRKNRYNKARPEIVRKTVHPLTHARDDIFTWNNEDSVWKKILEYFVEEGAVLDAKVDKPPFLTLTARGLSLLTELGALKPETIPYKQVYEDMKSRVRDDEDEFEDDMMFEWYNMFDEFMVYTGALLEELGPGIITKEKNKAIAHDLHALMPEKMRNAPSLQVLSRRVIRESIVKATQDNSIKNMNTLIDGIADDALPRHLKQSFLKMSGLHKIVERVEAENLEFGIEEIE